LESTTQDTITHLSPFLQLVLSCLSSVFDTYCEGHLVSTPSRLTGDQADGDSQDEKSRLVVVRVSVCQDGRGWWKKERERERDKGKKQKLAS
jgi:hypothetical protein